MKYIYIINGRADKAPQYKLLYEQLRQCPHLYDIYTTLGEGDATRYVRVYCDLYPQESVCFVACGGDGIINEVASGIVGFEHKEMAILFIGGSTADFLECYPGRDFRSVMGMLEGETQHVDIIKVNDSYSLNVCNFGFDARVASYANELIPKGVEPTKAFRQGIFKSILAGRFNRIKVVADGKRIGRGWLLLCTLANGRQVGGQFLCAPFAKNDDGLIEVCYLRAMSLLRFLLTMGPYRKGEHISNPITRGKVIYCQAREVTVTSKDLFDICLDGEIIPGSRFEVKILPKALPLRIPPLTSSNLPTTTHKSAL